VDAEKAMQDVIGTYKNFLTGDKSAGITVFRDRFNNMHERIEAFINEYGFTGQVEISGTNLAQALLAYFDEVDRIKYFHQIKRINEVKIHAYTAFWLLRKKPIQIIEDFKYCEEINELFVTFYLADFILKEKGQIELTGIKKEQYEEFMKTLNYAFKFRHFDAQNIELILLSFLAGFAVGSSV
jgi:hypothetical protein